jgi:hypothetical protein
VGSVSFCKGKHAATADWFISIAVQVPEVTH